MKVKDFTGIKNNGPLPAPEHVQVPDDIGDLMDDYTESLSSMLCELEEATMDYEKGFDRRENAAKIRRVLHKIKGESSMVGFDDVAELTHQAEFAFEELDENKRPDMLLKYKDWISIAMDCMTT